MHRTRRTAPRVLLAALVAAAAVLAVPGFASAREPRRLTGTYEVLAKDYVTADGGLEHHYTEVLRSPGKATPITLPPGHGIHPGTRLTVTVPATTATATSGTSAAPLRVASYERLAPASTIGSAGTTSVLVILAYWTKPDSVTPARARAQFFTDDDRWFREVSYGQAGLAGAVTPWVRIAAPLNGRCYDHAETLLSDARRKAATLGATYDWSRYDRTVLYFPRCSGSDTANVAGWAYEPGNVSWLNGYMDRRTSVHEQGHNYGMGHAKSLSCKSASGARTTFSTSCAASEYGDPFDAMGRAGYVGHFTGFRKAQAGWLGGSRKRELTSPAATTFTLPPFEKPSSRPLVVVAHSPTNLARSYWLEYRRPVGYDARLPAGATGGVLIHVADGPRRSWLLDATPKDATFSTAVLRSGTSWTAPDRVKFTVGAISSTGARVTVTGARPAPTRPGAPRSFVASASDEAATVTWVAPSSDGYSPITGYEITVTGSDGERLGAYGYDAQARTATLFGLTNGVTYTVSIAARNKIGTGPAARSTVTPRLMLPSVRVVSPAAGSTVKGLLTFHVEATPNPVTRSPIRCTSLYVDGGYLGGDCGTSTTIVERGSAGFGNGPHRLLVVASDVDGREVSLEQAFTVTNAHPVVTITSPASGTVFPDVEALTVEVAAHVPEDPGVSVRSVVLYDVTHGHQYVGHATTAPYRITVDVSLVYGTRKYVATAVADNDTTSSAGPVSVTVEHPASTVALTGPAPGATVSGTTVRLTATADVPAAGSEPKRVSFAVDGVEVGWDDTAPYAVDWDTSGVTGEHALSVRLVETSGRTATGARQAVTVANALPSVAVVTPGAYDAVPGGDVTISGTAAAGPGGAAPDRVVVTVDGRPIGTAPVGTDGAWSFVWNSGTRYGYVSAMARAYTPGGYHGASGFAFTLTRPEPAMTLVSPAAGGTVTRGQTVDVVISVVPVAGDPRTVTRACFYVVSYWSPRCSSVRDADGRFVVPWSVFEHGDPANLRLSAVMSDGYEHLRGGYYAVRIIDTP